MSENSDHDLKKGVEIVGELIKAAGNSEQGRVAAAEIGKTAVTVTKAVNNLLLPIAAINYGVERARIYFTQQFSIDLENKTKNIPVANVIEPKPLIAGPIINGLAFSHDEPCLKDMYLSLLTSAMDNRSAESAHPGFVEIIKQLDPVEARLLRNIIENPVGVPIVELRRKIKGQIGYTLLYRHLVNNCKEVNGVVTSEPEEFERFPAIIDNWERLGLVKQDYMTHLTGENAYDWVKNRPEYARAQKQVAVISDASVEIQRGLLVRTSWGKQFSKAVGLNPY